MMLLNSGAKAVLFLQLALSGQPGERLLRRRSRTAEYGDEGGSSYHTFLQHLLTSHEAGCGVSSGQYKRIRGCSEYGRWRLMNVHGK